MRKPYYRRDRKAWFVKTTDGRTQVRLHEDESRAYQIWQEMLGEGNPSSPNTIVATICGSFLDWAQKHVKPKTYRGYKDDLLSACNSFGTVRVRDLRKHHVTSWLDKQQSWGVWTRRRAGSALKRAFAWAVDEGYIAASPVQRLKLKKGGRRKVLVTDDNLAALMSARDEGRSKRRRDGSFRAVLIALRHTGARPGSIAALRAEDVSPLGDSWILEQHKNAEKTEKPLVIWLSPCLQTLTRILLAARPTGPLLLNSQGKRWTSNAIYCRMKGLRAKLKLPPNIVPYSFRHTWATNALTNGMDLATVAELLGNCDLKMLHAHYKHLDQKRDHLKKAAAMAMRRVE